MRAQSSEGAPPLVSSHYLQMSDGSVYPHQGRLEYMDNRIDPQTGMATVRATFPNPDRLLLPGQFVNLLTRSGTGDLAPVVPLASLLADASGSYVLLVNNESQVEHRNVSIRLRTGTHAIISSGLEGGELLIVEGLQRVRRGQTVDVTNAGPESLAQGRAGEQS
jgi:membrane fusion protein (multidrug efflux system)